MYYDSGFTVVLQDNYYGEELPRLAERLSGCLLHIVVLCPECGRSQAAWRCSGGR